MLQRGQRGCGLLFFLFVGAILLGPSHLLAVNALFIDDQTVAGGQMGVEIPIKCDNDFAIYAVSLAIGFDPSVLEVTSVDTTGVAQDAEWVSADAIPPVDNTAQRIVFGFFTEFDFAGPTDNVIPPGSAQEIVKLIVNTPAVAGESTTLLQLRDDLGDEEGELANAMTDGVGNTYRADSIQFPLTLDSGVITVVESSGQLFLRGDANNDGKVDISDSVTILQDQFLGIVARAPCRDAMDVNDDGRVDISDSIFILSFLFRGTVIPAQPYPAPGIDTTPDDLPDC